MGPCPAQSLQHRRNKESYDLQFQLEGLRCLQWKTKCNALQRVLEMRLVYAGVDMEYEMSI